MGRVANFLNKVNMPPAALGAMAFFIIALFILGHIVGIATRRKNEMEIRGIKR